MTSPARPPLPPPAPDELFVRVQEALAGEYSLERELGRGGMGVVYLAQDVRLARQVAIKVLPPALATSADLRGQFVREAQTAARLSHPNIVPIHRVDETGGFVFFVMTYVQGETLAQRVARRGPLTPHHAARVLREIAWALTYAHGAGIVHRDIKADNVMLETGTDRVIVMDFGIASTSSASARAADGHIAGSPHYASPEQIAGEPVDGASDLYSLGVVGFLALAGRLPFDAPTVREVVAMHLATPVPSLGALAPTVPPKLASLVESCMAKSVDDRPASASAFAEQLDAAIEMPRELPAPLRAWVNRANTTGGWQGLAAVIFAGVSSASVGAVTHSVLTGMTFGSVVGLAVGVLPSLLRMHRLVNAGYGIDDVRTAVREYWLRRREEIAFELTAVPNRVSRKRVLAILYGSGLATTFLQAIGVVTKVGWLTPLAVLTGVFGLGAGVLSISEAYRRWRLPWLGATQIKFYKSAWGEYWVRLAAGRSGPTHRASALPQLTEIALGRATDALYDALPRETRKQLKTLPDVVRRLEADAAAMRQEVDRLDSSIAQLDRDERLAAGAHLSDASRIERDRLHGDLRALRVRAGAKLAESVAALERVRLGLLRLQMGDGTIASVTASLDAAGDIAREVEARGDAAREVRRLLGSPPLAPRTSFP